MLNTWREGWLLQLKEQLVRWMPGLVYMPQNFQELQYDLVGSPILLNSMPKSGTHLLKRLMGLFGIKQFGRMVEHYNWKKDVHQNSLSDVLAALRELDDRVFGKRRYIFGHLVYNDKIDYCIHTRGYKMLMILRDPRDVVVSHVFHVMNKPTSKFHDYYKGLPGMKTRIAVTIRGLEHDVSGVKADWLPDVAVRYRAFAAWSKRANCFTARFEDLVGPQGGGSVAHQHRCIRDIASFLGFRISARKLNDVGAQVYSSKSTTYRRGKIGAWKDHFDSETCALFHAYAGDMLTEFGYTW